MAVRRLTADQIVQLAIDTLRAEVAPALGADKRYTAAMIVNALEIARRQVLADAEEASWPLLDRVYDDGEGTLAKLAADIRAGNVSDQTHPGLERELASLVVAELRIKNPRFLQSRQTTARAAPAG